tara:strand:+ start:240 stop:494 length:255 start_codon:yes stop_codon:yes gene_type:complete
MRNLGRDQEGGGATQKAGAPEGPEKPLANVHRTKARLLQARANRVAQAQPQHADKSCPAGGYCFPAIILETRRQPAFDESFLHV